MQIGCVAECFLYSVVEVVSERSNLGLEFYDRQETPIVQYSQIPFLRGPEEARKDDIALPRMDIELGEAGLLEYAPNQLHEAIEVFPGGDGRTIPSVALTGRLALAGASLPEVTDSLRESSPVTHDTLTTED